MKKIAILGSSFEFPSVRNDNDLWEGLINKRCFFHNASCPGDEYVKAWGGVENLKGFDYHFFGYSYHEASKMDPQHRHLLQHCWWAMENAGYMNRESLPVTAVFASASENHYLLQNLAGELQAGTENEALLGNLPDFLATRIAWKLGTTGPAFSVQCGCSSGLAALHQARVALLTGQAEMALVGAVSLAAPHCEGYDYLAGGIRSVDGKIRVFDRDASGTVFTNGVAALVLKPLHKALEDGDNILGVLESSALNNDGADKAGFTAPSVSGQRRVIQRAMKISNIAPEDIALYEAHGTGTRLGDPVEFAALREAWPTESVAEPTCALQSVKANLGHLDTVSGLAGIIKACLVLKHRQLPPQLNFEHLNPHITLEDSPFFINTEPRVLAENARYACISALGIGGTNAHVILSGAPVLTASSALSSSPHLFLLSAPSQKALGRVRNSWAGWQGDDRAIEKAAAMTRFGRTAFPVRQSVIAHSIEELKAGVKNAGSGVTVPDTMPSIVMMFTGQGSQYAGMGKQLYESSTYFRERLDEKLAILHQLSGKDYRAILFELQHEIHMPEHTQPGLLALEVALAEYLSHCGIRADLMLGHSLGEYSAMVAAKAMSFRDAASLVVVRAQLIQQTAPGAMCSIMAGAELLPSLLHGTEVDIAALNSDTLSVVSGSENELSRVMTRAQQVGIFCQPLKVKRAFHSRLLEPILPAFREALQNASFSATQIPVISTLTGQIEPFAHISQADYWVRQMREPVAFAAAVRRAAVTDKAVCFIEVGPGHTLKALASQNTHHPCINVLPHPAESEQADKVLMTAFGRLWEQGINIQWQNIHDRRPVPAIPVPPGYPFELTECWTEKQRTERLTLNSYQPCWVPLTRPERVTESTGEWLFITDGSSATAGMADMLCSRLTRQGARTRIISFEAESCHKMMKEAPDNILLLLHPETFRRETFKPLLILLEMVRNWRGQGARCLRIITQSAVDLLASPCPALAALTSAVKSLNQEYPALTTRLIDTDGQNEVLLAHEVTARWPVVVALRDADRFGEGFLAAPLTEKSSGEITPLRSVVILGGGGQVGLQYAKVFLENSQAHVCLLQRSSLESLREQGVKAGMQRADRIDALMQRWPGRLTLGEADVQSVSSLMTACQKARADMGSLDVLIHTAGIDASMHYQLIRDVDAPFCELSFAAKSQGLNNMAEVASSLEVPHCHVISSISSALGGIGMYIYGAMHAWLDAAVAELRRHHPSRWTLLNWEAWEFGNDEDVPEYFRQGAFGSELNRYAMQPAQGRRFLWQCWQDLQGQRIISSVDFQQRYREWVENHHETASSVDDASAQKAPRPDMKSEYQPPQTTAEEKIVAVWESLLGLHGIGIDDNFFELGGHSLLALRMTGQVNQSVNASMSMVDIFQYPTVRKLAASITGNRSFDTARADAAQRAQRRRQSQNSKRA